MNETVLSTCEVFVVPAAILFGAIGVASTQRLKTLVSLTGLITSGLWAARIWLLPGATPNKYPFDGIPIIDLRFGLAFAVTFVLAYAVSTFAHGKAWSQGQDVKLPPNVNER